MQLLKKISISVLTYHIPFLFNAKFKIYEFDLSLNLTFLLIAKGNIYSKFFYQSDENFKLPN